MKPLKTLVLATCLVGAVTSFASAKDVKHFGRNNVDP